MKQSLFILALGTTFASSVSISNNSSPSTGVALLDSSGFLLTDSGAHYDVGFANSGTLDLTSAVNLSSSFTSFTSGSPVAFTTISHPDGGSNFNNGFISESLSGVTIDGTNGFSDQQAIVIFSNASTIASSTEFAIFAGPNFLSDDGLGTDNTPTIVVNQSSLLHGDSITGSFSLTIDAGGFGNSTTTFTNGVQLTALSAVAVPEPSTLTLAGLGAIALITRRRRA